MLKLIKLIPFGMCKLTACTFCVSVSFITELECFQFFSFMFWHLGVDIVCKALRMPALTIAKNAGVDAHVVVEKVMNETGDVGYDAMNDRHTNLFESGIVDPTKVCMHLAALNMLQNWLFFSFFCPLLISSGFPDPFQSCFFPPLFSCFIFAG